MQTSENAFSQDPDDSPPARVQWEIFSDIVGPYSLVELTLHRGDAGRVRREGQSGWQFRPPAYVYAQSHGMFRLAGKGAVAAIPFRVSPIIASSLLSRPPAEIWNEPVALADFRTFRTSAPRHLFKTMLKHAPPEQLDLLSSQLGWSACGLRRLFADSAILSSQDENLVSRHLDAYKLLREEPGLGVKEVAGHAGFLDHAVFTDSFHERPGHARIAFP